MSYYPNARTALINGRKNYFVSVTEDIELQFEGTRLVKAWDWHYINRESDAYKTPEELKWFKTSPEYKWAYQKGLSYLKAYITKDRTIEKDLARHAGHDYLLIVSDAEGIARRFDHADTLFQAVMTSFKHLKGSEIVCKIYRITPKSRTLKAQVLAVSRSTSPTGYCFVDNTKRPREIRTISAGGSLGNTVRMKDYELMMYGLETKRGRP